MISKKILSLFIILLSSDYAAAEGFAYYKSLTSSYSQDPEENGQIKVSGGAKSHEKFVGPGKEGFVEEVEHELTLDPSNPHRVIYKPSKHVLKDLQGNSLSEKPKISEVLAKQKALPQITQERPKPKKQTEFVQEALESDQEDQVREAREGGELVEDPDDPGTYIVRKQISNKAAASKKPKLVIVKQA